MCIEQLACLASRRECRVDEREWAAERSTRSDPTATMGDVATNDHTVPQFYLRRFASKTKGTAHRLVAAPVEDLNAAFSTNVRNVAAVNNFHWGTDPGGVPHHTMEALMTSIETAAAPAFSAVLDTEHALPARWPPTPAHRARLSWWIAAQILRTTRQRHRLSHLSDQAAEGGMPRALGAPTSALTKLSRNNQHLDFITENLAPLAAIVASKPWGVGFSDACLPTSDVPVVLMNQHDAERQLVSAALWDVVLPLDPHRLLIMRARGSGPDPATWIDHRLKLDSGFGVFVIDMIWSAAEEHLFWHPDHEPPTIREVAARGRRLPRPWAGDAHSEPQSILEYGALPASMTVERRWLTEHPPPPST